MKGLYFKVRKVSFKYAVRSHLEKWHALIDGICTIQILQTPQDGIQGEGTSHFILPRLFRAKREQLVQALPMSIITEQGHAPLGLVLYVSSFQAHQCEVKYKAYVPSRFPSRTRGTRFPHLPGSWLQENASSQRCEMERDLPSFLYLKNKQVGSKGKRTPRLARGYITTGAGRSDLSHNLALNKLSLKKTVSSTV